MPIGFNDAVHWPTLDPLFRRRDVGAVDAYLAELKRNGVNCIRLMLEYAQGRHRFLERPPGRFVPSMVALWDDLFALCLRHEIRLLLTPFDTFWHWLRFKHHPYNSANGGMLDHASRFILCETTRRAIKGRLEFAVRRWGASGAVFAWDLWNEIHPAQAMGSAVPLNDFVTDLGSFVRNLELSLYGRSHLQTVSLFSPELASGCGPALTDLVFRRRDLDFATIHVYEEGTIDDPADTVTPALAAARIVREALAEIRDGRPFLDSEHGPIHRFKDKHETLPEAFDDEYFRHFQWAHLAAGGAGGGMRWPNRSPHMLTAGMWRAQASLHAFLELLDWGAFRRVNLNDEVGVSDVRIGVAACGDAAQALVWLVRRDSLRADGTLDPEQPPLPVAVSLPGLAPGRYELVTWNTAKGGVLERRLIVNPGEFHFTVPVGTDIAVAIARR